MRQLCPGLEHRQIGLHVATKLVLKLEATPRTLVSLRAAVRNITNQLVMFNVKAQVGRTTEHTPFNVRCVTDQLIESVLRNNGFTFNENPQHHNLVIMVVPDDQYMVRLSWADGAVDYWAHFDLRKGLTQKVVVCCIRCP